MKNRPTLKIFLYVPPLSLKTRGYFLTFLIFSAALEENKGYFL
jgi:hypothetical protein